jgi:hypothetical protein
MWRASSNSNRRQRAFRVPDFLGLPEVGFARRCIASSNPDKDSKRGPGGQSDATDGLNCGLEHENKSMLAIEPTSM